MERISPITSSSTKEVSESPDAAEFENTVYWAISVENSELANFYFHDDVTDTIDKHYQLLGPHHHLTSLDDERIRRVRAIFREYDPPEDELEPRLYKGKSSMDVELTHIEGTEHISIAKRVMDEVYNTSPKEITRIERTTFQLNGDGESPGESKLAVCDRCALSANVEYMLNAYGDIYYQGEDYEGRTNSDLEYDFVFSKDGYWICKDCFQLQ